MLRTIGLVISLVFLMVACGGGDGGAVSAPSSLQYAVGTGEVGSPYGPYPPSVTGTVTGYSVSPALPAGLTLDPNSGVISGTPLAASSGTTYTVTASNGEGAATAVLTLEILAPPAALTYTSPVTGMVGSTLTQVVPTLSGHADAFTVYPPLPAGLVLDPATGTVSGTPTSARLPLTYTVVASNMGGALTKSQFLLTVDPPPAGTAVSGVFRSDTVIGLGYVSGSHVGLTDKSGAFTYEEGHGITFSVGGVSIGGVPTAKTLVTPVDLVAQATGDSNRVLNLVRFLMMLDQDGNANNGIQISTAVNAAAASWAPVDFDTTDLPTALGPIIQQASTADGVSHVLPDAATAQAHLRTAFYCTHSGNYYGTIGTNSTPPGMRDDIAASVFPYGGMETLQSTYSPVNNLLDHTTVSALLDGTFGAVLHPGAYYLEGSFADATYLSGTYLAVGDLGNFQAVGDASVTATYKFSGSYTETLNDPTKGGPYYSPLGVYFGMDDSNQVSGKALGTLTGAVSGNTFTGTVSYFKLDALGFATHLLLHFPVSGTYSNTASGATFDGQFTTNDSVVTFSTVGCRAN
jgi:Putative Ig domain